MLQGISTKVLTFLVLLVSSIAALAQVDTTETESVQPEFKVTIRSNQIIQRTIDLSVNTRNFLIINPTDQSGIVDFVALDRDGQEMDRANIEFPAKQQSQVSIPKELIYGSNMVAESVWIQVFLLPKTDQTESNAISLPIAFFSQANSQWGSNQIGTCTTSQGVKKTIKQLGCALSSVAMASANWMSNSNPGSLNTWLTGHSGYASSSPTYLGKCDLIWSKAADYDGSGGFKYYSSLNGTVGTAAHLKSLIDGGYYVVAYSKRYENIGSTHWTVIYKYTGTGTSLSNFEYLDPGDSSYKFHTVNDAFVKSSSNTRIYR